MADMGRAKTVNKNTGMNRVRFVCTDILIILLLASVPCFSFA
jgi:hypothetical protein